MLSTGTAVASALFEGGCCVEQVEFLGIEPQWRIGFALLEREVCSVLAEHVQQRHVCGIAAGESR